MSLGRSDEHDIVTDKKWLMLQMQGWGRRCYGPGRFGSCAAGGRGPGGAQRLLTSNFPHKSFTDEAETSLSLPCLNMTPLPLASAGPLSIDSPHLWSHQPHVLSPAGHVLRHNPPGRARGVCNLLGATLSTPAHNPLIQLADERGASFPGTWLHGSCLVSLQCPAQASTGPELAHSKCL